jgi:hypothetical protein
LARRAPIGPALEEVLETPAQIPVKGGPRVVVVFDEFQQILEPSLTHAISERTSFQLDSPL